MKADKSDAHDDPPPKLRSCTLILHQNPDVDYRDLHPWNPTPAEAVRIQKRLRESIRIEPLKKRPRLIAGCDISYNRFSSTAYAAFVVLDAKTAQIVDHAQAVGEMTFPYIPGLLSFREIPILLIAWRLLEKAPDVVVADGQGIAHPRRLGIASHLGLCIETPTIGCAKSLLVGKYEGLDDEAGSMSDLTDRGERIGVALRTKYKVQPVYASPGHLIDFEGSVDILRSMSRGYRIPEPTRQAHLWVNRIRRDANEAAA